LPGAPDWTPESVRPATGDNLTCARIGCWQVLEKALGVVGVFFVVEEDDLDRLPILGPRQQERADGLGEIVLHPVEGAHDLVDERLGVLLATDLEPDDVREHAQVLRARAVCETLGALGDAGGGDRW
jgi:hypothetical protein